MTTTAAVDPVEAARRRIQAIEDAEDAEFDYELYKRSDHPISKVDWRDIPLFDVGLNANTLNDDTEAGQRAENDVCVVRADVYFLLVACAHTTLFASHSQ